MLIILFDVEIEGVGELKLSNLLKSFAFYEFANSSAVGYFHHVSLKVAVGKAKVKILLRVFHHLTEF